MKMVDAPPLPNWPRALPASLTNGQLVRALEAPRNLGYAGGVNSCLMETPAQSSWFLNPDTKPLPEALEVLVDRLRVGNCEAAGCTVHLASGQIQSYGGRWSPWLARGVSMGRGDPLGQPIDRASIERTRVIETAPLCWSGELFSAPSAR